MKVNQLKEENNFKIHIYNWRNWVFIHLMAFLKLITCKQESLPLKIIILYSLKIWDGDLFKVLNFRSMYEWCFNRYFYTLMRSFICLFYFMVIKIFFLAIWRINYTFMLLNNTDMFTNVLFFLLLFTARLNYYCRVNKNK